MVGRIGAVGGEANLEYYVLFQTQLFGRRRAGLSFGGQDKDTFVAVANAQLVFGTNHPGGFSATDFTFFDFEGIAFPVQHLSADGGHQHFLSLPYIGCTTYDGKGFALINIYRAKRQTVCLRMFFTGEDLTNHHTFQAIVSGLKHLHTFHFQSQSGQQMAHLLRREVYF